MTKAKEKILSAAEELIAQNGSSETTISKIAEKAGVADSLVYQYFNGKEDLLFSIAYRNIKIVFELLDEQLQGIIDPISRLSKIIWYFLNYHDRHPRYAKIMMFECHSKKAFYESPAYQLHQRVFGKVYEILMQGVEKEVFRNDVDMNLVMEIITGMIGAEILNTLNTREVTEGSRDLDDIMALILPMILAKEKKVDRNKANRILDAAEKVFSRNGFSGAKISEIAKLAGVAEGTIYEYFKHKEDLLLSIPANRFETSLDILSGPLQIDKPLQKLQWFFKNHFHLFLTEPDFLKIFLLHIRLNRRFYGTRSYEIYWKYVRVLDDILEEGKADGSFRSVVNARIFRSMFFGAFNYMAIRWLVLGNSQMYDKMMEVHNLVDLLTSAVICVKESGSP